MHSEVVDSEIFKHPNAKHSKRKGIAQLQEDAKQHCGISAIVLRYDYKLPPLTDHDFGSSIRRVPPDGQHYTKPYGPEPTLVVRFHGMLSHLIMMLGQNTKAFFSLKPGRVLPAARADEGV